MKFVYSHKDGRNGEGVGTWQALHGALGEEAHNLVSFLEFKWEYPPDCRVDGIDFAVYRWANVRHTASDEHLGYFYETD